MTDSLTITIIVIVLVAIVGAFIKGRTRDKCLQSYAKDLVAFLRVDGKAIWGRLHVESTGLEFKYVKEHKDTDGHIETSYILYPPTQKTTGLPVDECENKQIFCSGDVRPFLEKAPDCRQV